MCRFVFYQGASIQLSALISQPEHSLIDQSIHAEERESPINGDGFGVAWYQLQTQRQPAVFKSIKPAWSDHNLRELSNVISSPCILAHVRAATGDSEVSEANCHPFKWKEFAFMHNGVIGGFKHIKKRLISTLSEEVYAQIKGSTDSEYFFALIIDELIKMGEHTDMRMATSAGLKRLFELQKAQATYAPSYLNFVLSDGRKTLIAKLTDDYPDKAQSLHYKVGTRYVCEGGVCRVLDEKNQSSAIIVSSEPLNRNENWQDVEVNTMMSIQDSSIISVVKWK